MSHYKEVLETIRFHRTTADKLQDELNDELELLFEEGLIARPSDEDPIKATYKVVAKLIPGGAISASEVKQKVPSTRDLTHRAITGILNRHEMLVDSGEKDQFGLKVFRRIEDLLTAAE